MRSCIHFARAGAWARLAALGALAACGKVTGSPDSGAVADATPGAADAAGGADAAGTSRCSPDAPILEVEPVAELNALPDETGIEFHYRCCLSFAADGTAYFAAGALTDFGGADIYRARRSATGFAAAEVVIGAGVDDSFWVPSLSRDGLSLYYNHLSADGLGAIEIFLSTRDGPDAPFEAGARVELGAPPGEQEADPFITDEGLFFTRGGRIHFAALDPVGGGFAPAQPVQGLPEGGANINPGASADLAALYWARDDGSGTTGRDLWMARRSTAGGYESARPVPEDTGGGEPLNTPAFEGPDWESPDGCDLYFTTDRTGEAQHWVARRRAM